MNKSTNSIEAAYTKSNEQLCTEFGSNQEKGLEENEVIKWL